MRGFSIQTIKGRGAKVSRLRELRGTVRFPAELPVSLSWKVHGQPQCQGEGVTRNISSRGMFVLAHRSPGLGTTVHFEVSLVAGRGSAAIGIEGQGTVVRLEPRASPSGMTGFAVVNVWLRVKQA